MGLRGGGKRGASTTTRSGRKVDANKEDVIAEMILLLQRTLQSLSTCNIPQLVTMLTRITQMQNTCMSDSLCGVALLQSFNNPQLQTLNLAAGGGNKDYKVNLVRTYVFQDEFKIVTQIESEIEVVKEAMTNVCRLILTTTFASGKGEIGWSDIQEDIMKMLTSRARSEGVQVAHTAAAAAAATAAAMGGVTPAEREDETMRF